MPPNYSWFRSRYRFLYAQLFLVTDLTFRCPDGNIQEHEQIIRIAGYQADEHGYGMANLELEVPITPNAVFAIASITKLFTAVSVMLAAQQGKLSLDDLNVQPIPKTALYVNGQFLENCFVEGHVGTSLLMP